jgi:OmpA-OmpF porin, OOP family
MKKALGVLAALLPLSPATAQDTGFYAGLAIGNSSYREACATSGEDTAFKLFGGWRFHANLAAEVSLIDFGEAKGSGTIGGAPVTGTTRVRGAGLAALGILPLDERMSLFGRLGLLKVKSRTQLEGASGAIEADDEIELHVGIGGMLHLARGFSLRLEYERLNDTKIDLLSLGLQYRF